MLDIEECAGCGERFVPQRRAAGDRRFCRRCRRDGAAIRAASQDYRERRRVERRERIAWLIERRKGIGGSDIATLAGLNEWQTPLEVYLEKVSTQEPDPEMSTMMRLGQVLEDGILQLWQEAEDIPIVRPGIQVHPKHSTWRSTPDAMSADLMRGAEVKTTVRMHAHQWGESQPETAGARPDAWCQAQWNMGVTRTERWDVIVFFVDSREMDIYPVTFDPDAFAQLSQVADAFWNDHVAKRIPPLPDADEFSEWARLVDPIAQMFDASDGLQIEATPDLIAEANVYKQAHAMANDWKDAKDAAKAKIQLMMEDATKATWDGGSVSWSKVQGRQGTDWETLARNLMEEMGLPDPVREKVLADYLTRGAPHRRLSVHIKKK